MEQFLRRFRQKVSRIKPLAPQTEREGEAKAEAEEVVEEEEAEDESEYPGSMLQRAIPLMRSGNALLERLAPRVRAARVLRRVITRRQCQ